MWWPSKSAQSRTAHRWCGLRVLPLQPVVEQAIKDVSSQAPFGKGSETIVDTAVRNSLQIESSKVAIL